MKVRRIACAALAAAATATGSAQAPKPPPAERAPIVREQSVLAEALAGMRAVLRAVTPEIRLPALEIDLPTLDLRAR